MSSTRSVISILSRASLTGVMFSSLSLIIQTYFISTELSEADLIATAAAVAFGDLTHRLLNNGEGVAELTINSANEIQDNVISTGKIFISEGRNLLFLGRDDMPNTGPDQTEVDAAVIKYIADQQEFPPSF